MNPVLLLPAGLAALTALALPLLIHLARRQQQRPTVFAALRWLQARPRPRRRIRFDEPWLLAVRLLLVALLALLLAHPALLGVVDERPRLLVAPGVDAATVASVAGEGVQAHWLAPGFPALDQPPPAAAFATASLLREFDAALPPGAPLTVLVPQRLDGADGARVQLTREVDWRIVESGPDMQTAPEPATLAPPRLAIRHDAAHGEGVAYLRAAALAWQGDGGQEADVAASDDPPAQDVDVLAWLHAGAPLPALLAWVAQGGQLLLPADAELPGDVAPTVAWRDDAGEPLLHIVRLGRGRLLQLRQPLAPAAMPQLLDPGFAQALRELVQPLPVPTVVAASDYRPRSGAIAAPAAPEDLRPWLALLIALLALLERWLATSRRRGALA